MAREVERVKDDYRRYKEKLNKCEDEKEQMKARYQEKILKLKAKF